MTDTSNQPLNPFSPAAPAKVEGTKPTPPTNLFDATPQERFQAQEDEIARSDPWRNPDLIARRDDRQNITFHDKETGKRLDGEPIDQPGQEGERPPVDGSTAHKFGDLELTESQIRDLVAHKAETDLRKAQVPATPGEYKLDLPKDLKLSEGVSFTIADPIKGPALQAAQVWAQENGLSQSQFSELLGLYAVSESREKIMISDAARAEREKLGVTGTTRVDAISMFLRGRYGDTAAKPMISTLVTEGQVRIWEDVITRLTNGGGGSYSRRGNEPEPQKLSDAAYDQMSYTEKKNYAARASAGAAQGGRR